MFCQYCGSHLSDDSRFCSLCGAPVRQPAPYAYAPPAAPVSQEQQQAAGDALKWSIIGAAFAVTAWLSFLGIIFSSIAKKKVKVYSEQYGVLTGKARAASIISKAGFICGIILTAVCIVYLIFLIFAMPESFRILNEMFDDITQLPY